MESLSSGLLLVCHPVPDVRRGNNVFVSLGRCGSEPRPARSAGRSVLPIHFSSRPCLRLEERST